jgi:hypothetical protein
MKTVFKEFTTEDDNQIKNGLAPTYNVSDSTVRLKRICLQLGVLETFRPLKT